jgi:hypothetical protein
MNRCLVSFRNVTARAGWFPDPAGRPDHYRWWDGSAWTRLLTTHPKAAGQPSESEAARAAGTATVAGTEAQSSGQDQEAEPRTRQQAGAVSLRSPAGRQTRPPGYERPSDAEAAWKPALLAVAAVIVVGGIVLAIVLFGRPAPPALQPPAPRRADSSSPPSPSPSASPTGPSSYDATTRVFSYDGLQLTLPGKPYITVKTGSTDLGGSAGVGVESYAVVHKNDNGKFADWDASVEVDQVGSQLTGETLEQTADKIVVAWARGAFAGSRAKVMNEQKRTITKNEPRPARVITADMHYSVKGLASKYDHVSLLVTKGPSGSYVAFLSSRPDDASAKIKSALQASINTVRLN